MKFINVVDSLESKKRIARYMLSLATRKKVEDTPVEILRGDVLNGELMNLMFIYKGFYYIYFASFCLNDDIGRGFYKKPQGSIHASFITFYRAL